METPEIPNLGTVLPDYGLTIQSRRQRPGFNTEPHSHIHNSLMYVVAGHGQCTIDSNIWQLGPDMCIVLPAGRLHQLTDAQSRPMVVFVVYFNDEVTGANMDVAGELLRKPQPYAIPRLYAQQIRRTLRRMLYEQDHRPPQYAFSIRQCLSFLLLELYRVRVQQYPSEPVQQDSSGRVREALDYIAGRYFEPHSLSDAARMSHLSQRQFANLCRKLTGRTFVSYVNGIRMERARQLLLNTEMSVSAIAFEVGFEELSTFYRAFRKQWNVSPLSLRK